MKIKTLFFLNILFLSFQPIIAQQSNPEFIQINKEKGENAYYLNYELLTHKQIRKLTHEYPQAYKQAKKAQANRAINQVLGVSGGLLMGFPIGTWLAGGDPNWPIAYIGMGVAGISIPFYYLSQSRIKKAVNQYNTELLNDPEKNKMEMSLNFYGAGVGFRLRF